MRPFKSLSLAALLCALFVSPVRADPNAPTGGPGGPGGPGMEGRLEKQLGKLGLSDSQNQKVQAILTAAKPQRDAMRGQMRQAFQDMRSLLDQDAPDQNAVMAQADRIGQLQTQAHKDMLTTLLAVRAELSPAQRAQLRESMHEHMQGRWHRWHHGYNRGGQGAPPSGGAPAPTPETSPED
ncbi:MAG TPA: Spy/CpxP family protein refolding chaperone [Myxococcota bacterium]|nr:Spy/CpxP family protein refolding chaperone [Myxococcota bacterium]